jgi:G3E family GTPase
MTPIPIVLVTGYLGAGKTTFINHLLSLPEVAENKLALVINEFGALGVDGKLVRPGGYAKFEINHGSLFCICTLADLVKALDTIARATRPDRVLVEVTGIAETRDFEGLLSEPRLFGQFKLQANVCVVDALDFTKVAGFLTAASRQVEWADGIILNKADLVDESDLGKLGAVLRTMNADAPQVAARHGAVPFSFLKNLTHKRRSGDMATRPPPQIVAVSFQTDRVIDRARFQNLLRSLGTRILRLKGNIEFGEGPRFVEVVYDKFSEKPACEALGPNTAFTAIASQISTDELRVLLEATRKTA